MATETLSNAEMEQRLNVLSTMMECKGKVAYAIAYNARKLQDQLVEYSRLKTDLIKKYGHETDDGYAIEKTDDNFKKFESEFLPIAEITHSIDIFTIPYDEAIGDLSAKQLFDIMWMLEDGQNA